MHLVSSIFFTAGNNVKKIPNFGFTKLFFMKIYPFIVVLLFLSSCFSLKYNFTGGAPPDPRIKTLSVIPFTNESPLVIAYHSQQFTEQLRNRFLQQSSLSLLANNGDVQLSGAILSYNINPVAVSSGTTINSGAAQNRMEVSVKVKYENRVNPIDNWEQTFRSFQDFNAGTPISSVERELIEKINDQLTQDIFSKSLGKW